MGRPIQLCPMCGLVKPVACSHLISRSPYDHVDDGVTSPILVGDGYVMPTDRQIQDYLPCDGCEDILSKGGDMLKAGGGFHAAGEGEGIYYAAKNPDIHVEKIIHFAMGIFWKAGVHSWKGGAATSRRSNRPSEFPATDAFVRWAMQFLLRPSRCSLRTLRLRQVGLRAICGSNPFGVLPEMVTSRTSGPFSGPSLESPRRGLGE